MHRIKTGLYLASMYHPEQLNNEQNVQVSDTTGVDSSTIVEQTTIYEL